MSSNNPLNTIDSMISMLENTNIDTSNNNNNNNDFDEKKKDINQNELSSKKKSKKKNKKKSNDDEKIDLNQGRIPGTQPNNCELSLDERFKIGLTVGEECIENNELKELLQKSKTRPIAYDGFEPSGRMHIAQGILKSICVNKLTKIGCDFTFWVADWFALLNNKMGGDLNKIRDVGNYMIEVWKAAGMDMDNVYFRWASDDINNNSNEYWLRVIEISKMFSITRVKRCCTIMGRSESDDMPTANLMYAAMQCADIFFLKASICQLGLDQRKVNMLAREYAKKKNIKPPIIISHHMLMGLKEGQEKMSKSSPDSAIFMEDSPDDVNRKIKKAYGPPGVIDGNPLLDYTKHIIFGKFDKFTIKRKEKNGGDITYNDYKTLEDDYKNDKLHPGDLKPALAKAINELLQPVRDHFKKDKRAKKLLAKVKKYRVTR